MSLLARILDSMRRGSSGRLFDIGFDEKGLTMESLLERCAGLDLHKDIITACVRVPGDNGERSIYQHEFGTTTQELPGLRDWLSSYRVTVVGMEATWGLPESTVLYSRRVVRVLAPKYPPHAQRSWKKDRYW